MIFFLYGEDTYRSRQKLIELKAKFKKEVDPSGLNLTIIDGGKINLDGLNQAISCLPFLAKRRMVVIEDLFLNKDGQVFSGLLEKLKNSEGRDNSNHSTVDNECLKVFWQGGSAAPKKAKEAGALWNFLAGQKFSAEFLFLKGVALARFVTGQFAKQGVSIDEPEVAQLIMLVGRESWSLKNEIDKLAAFVLSLGRDKVTVEMINRQIRAQFDENIFKLVDAVSQRQKNQAVKLINEQLDNGVNEMYLLSMLASSFRNLILVKETPPQDQAKLGLHPFVIKKALAQCGRFSAPELRAAYQKLLELDEKTKTSFAKPDLLLDLFLVTV